MFIKWYYLTRGCQVLSWCWVPLLPLRDHPKTHASGKHWGSTGLMLIPFQIPYTLWPEAALQFLLHYSYKSYNSHRFSPTTFIQVQEFYEELFYEWDCSNCIAATREDIGSDCSQLNKQTYSWWLCFMATLEALWPSAFQIYLNCPWNAGHYTCMPVPALNKQSLPLVSYLTISLCCSVSSHKGLTLVTLFLTHNFSLHREGCMIHTEKAWLLEVFKSKEVWRCVAAAVVETEGLWWSKPKAWSKGEDQGSHDQSWDRAEAVS